MYLVFMKVCYLCKILMKFKFYIQIFKKISDINFMQIRPMRTDLFHAEVQRVRETYKQTNKHDETSRRFPKFCKRA